MARSYSPFAARALPRLLYAITSVAADSSPESMRPVQPLICGSGVVRSSPLQQEIFLSLGVSCAAAPVAASSSIKMDVRLSRRYRSGLHSPSCLRLRRASSAAANKEMEGMKSRACPKFRDKMTQVGLGTARAGPSGHDDW